MASDKALKVAQAERLAATRKRQSQRAQVQYIGRSMGRLVNGEVLTIRGLLCVKADGEKCIVDPHTVEPISGDNAGTT